MADPKEIKAYIQDASGQLVPLAADSLVLQFPSGDTLEIAWDAPHPDDPRPVGAQIWGGRRITRPLSDEEIAALPRATALGLLPSAANLVLVHPYSHERVK